MKRKSKYHLQNFPPVFPRLNVLGFSGLECAFEERCTHGILKRFTQSVQLYAKRHFQDARPQIRNLRDALKATRAQLSLSTLTISSTCSRTFLWPLTARETYRRTLCSSARTQKSAVIYDVSGYLKTIYTSLYIACHVDKNYLVINNQTINIVTLQLPLLNNRDDTRVTPSRKN